MAEVNKTLGQIAFEAYRAEVQGAAYDDKPIPEWDDLHGNKERAHRGWEAAAAAIQQRTLTLAAVDDSLARYPEGWTARGGRPLKSHAQPLSDFLPKIQADGLPEHMTLSQEPQVAPWRAEVARASVPVEADDATGDDDR